MIKPQKGLKDYPLDEFLEEFSNTGKLKNKFPEAFFRHSMPFLAQNIKLETEDGLINASATLAGMKNNGNALANKIFKMHAIVPRSVIMSGKQTAQKRYNSAVPLVMSAFKEYQGIGYDTWNKKDPAIKYFLGKALHGLVDIQEYEEVILDYNDIIKYREKFMTYSSGSKVGEVEPATAWKLNKPDGLVSSKVVRGDMIARMLLQTWAYNIQYRGDYMILNPWHWDDIPEPVDLMPEELLKPDSDTELDSLLGF